MLSYVTDWKIFKKISIVCFTAEKEKQISLMGLLLSHNCILFVTQFINNCICTFLKLYFGHLLHKSFSYYCVRKIYMTTSSDETADWKELDFSYYFLTYISKLTLFLISSTNQFHNFILYHNISTKHLWAYVNKYTY